MKPTPFLLIADRGLRPYVGCCAPHFGHTEAQEAMWYPQRGQNLVSGWTPAAAGAIGAWLT